MYRNAKQELLKAIENNSVVCAEIYFNSSEKISLSSFLLSILITKIEFYLATNTQH